MVPTTDRARKVLEIAGKFAGKSAGSSVEADNLLLALASEGDGLAAYALRSFGIDGDAIRTCLERLPKTSDNDEGIDQLLLWAKDELVPLQHTYVGTEHLLLAITRVSGGRCLAALTALGLQPSRIREEVYSILGHVAVTRADKDGTRER
jgi:ATP-dependent Clp protease ATP-binding subunit ClpC